MAYQNVSTPRFYIDYLSYWFSQNLLYKYTHLSGVSGGFEEWLGLNPSSIASFTSASSGNYRNWLRFEGFSPDSLTIPSEKMWSGVFGHNLAQSGIGFSSIENTSAGNTTSSGVTGVVNDSGHANATDGDVPFDGYSIRTFNPGSTNITGVHFRLEGTAPGGYEVNIGSCGYGGYYDMPVAPDLSLSLEHDYSGIKKTTSMSGASFSNANWIKPPKWGDKEAWQLGDFPRPYSGRRVWDLSFSYISDSDLEPRNYTGTTDDTPPQQGDDNWFENVLHYTMGGHLPFIFQPDKDATYSLTDTSPAHITEIPEFAICRFDMNSFSREQVAPNVYNIKVKIKESW